MPIYEYECGACGYQHEVLQKISDPLLTKCPQCGEEALRKLISAAGFRLSGSGWYETDFKSGDKKNLHSKESEKKPAVAKAEGKKSSESKSSQSSGSSTSSSTAGSSSS